MDFQHFLRLSGKSGAFGVVSHGTHSYCRNGGKLRLGILRSPTYATHEENIGPEFDRYLNRYMPRQEQGIRHAKFSFLFGDAAGTTEATAKAALECNVPLDPFVYFPTKRTVRPSRQSLASTSAENVLIVALKKAEEGDDLIVRLWKQADERRDFGCWSMARPTRSKSGHGSCKPSAFPARASSRAATSSSADIFKPSNPVPWQAR